MTSLYNRRYFLRRSASIAAGVTAATLWRPPSPLLAQIGSSREPLPPIDDPRIKSLVQRGLDASRAAGAAYTDVRLSHWYNGEQESMTVGVRALVNGYWGFASGPVWSTDEMARLGQEATHLAIVNALGKPRPTTLASAPVIRDGQWTTPIRIDPFALHPNAIRDILGGLEIYGQRRTDHVEVHCSVDKVRHKIAFGSSEGSYCTQQKYLTSGSLEINYFLPNGGFIRRWVDGLDAASVGFELVDEPRLQEAMDTVIEEIKADLALPVRPVDVGRYDLVLDAKSVARVLDGTIGLATELDRALGYEANMTGTSYLNEPFDMIGTLPLGSPLLTVTMNRNEPGGAATAQWDDEGVSTRSITLVKNGILTDFQTTRESAVWLHDQAHRQDAPPQSTGSSYAPTAMDAPLARTGNLVLQPSAEHHTVDDLVANMTKGILFCDLEVKLDFQQLNGYAFKGRAYEIRNGKKVARIGGAGLLFRAPELWKSLNALGGADSAYRVAMKDKKGQPSQLSTRSITTVPATFTQVPVIDPARKA